MVPGQQSPSRRVRWRKRIIKVVLIILMLWLLFAFGLAIAIHIYALSVQPEPADVIVVLGAGVRRNGSPGPALTRRAEQGALLWKQGYAPYILCTGAQAAEHPRSEASACREVLMANGVPDEYIIMEERSRSTEENALYTREMMQERGWRTALIVSDSYHLLRANMIFSAEAIDFSMSGIPAAKAPFGFYVYAVAREVLGIHWQVVKELLGLPVTHLTGI